MATKDLPVNVFFIFIFYQRRQLLFRTQRLQREGMQLLTSIGGVPIQDKECLQIQAKQAQS